MHNTITQCGIISQNGEMYPIYYSIKTKTFWVDNEFSGKCELEANLPKDAYVKELPVEFDEDSYIGFMHALHALGIIIIDKYVITIHPTDDFEGDLRILNRITESDATIVPYNLYGEYQG